MNEDTKTLLSSRRFKEALKDVASREAERASGYPTITKLGTVVVRGGVVFIEDDWEFENADCREAARLGMLVALERIQKALNDDLMRNNPTSVRGNAADYFAE